jgi:hypothetical protein
MGLGAGVLSWFNGAIGCSYYDANRMRLIMKSVYPLVVMTALVRCI